MNLDNWQVQLRKGLLELAILTLLSKGRHHGYEMVRQLKQMPGFAIREGNIYPILARLQADGVINSTAQRSPDGPPRKYFELTDIGQAVLNEMNQRWKSMQNSVETIQKGTRK